MAERFPVRCYTSGDCIAYNYEKYVQYIEFGFTPLQALELLGVEKYCCRKTFLTFAGEGTKMVHYQNLDKCYFPSLNRPVSMDEILNS